MKLHATITIAQPPEKIWNFWLPVSTDALWRGGIIKAEWRSSPPYGVGSSGIHYAKGLGEITWKIVRWEEGRYFEFVHTEGKLKGSVASYHVEPENGGSRVSLIADLSGPFIIRVIIFFIKGKLHKELQADLEKLRDVMEGTMTQTII